MCTSPVRVIVCLLALFVAPSINATEFHISPTGTPRGTGAADAPWDLGTGLAAFKIVQPGDTVWLHGGTYRGGFTSQLTGKPEQPVVIRGVAGERATIDTLPRDERDNGLLAITGADAIYRDFEVMCSEPLRKSKFPGSWPADIRRGNVFVRADRVSLVNLVLHDLDSGVGFWEQGESGEVNGCLVYYNGWNGPDRAHGHAIYAQNSRGTKRLVDNIVFDQFGYGIHVYGSKKASLKGFEVAGNIAFGNGSLSPEDNHSPGIMIGGESPAERIAVRDNVVVGGGIRLGYPWGTTNEDVVVSGNYTDFGLVVRDFRKATVTGNTVVAPSTVISLEAADRLLITGHKWSDNDYYVSDGRWGDCSIIEQGKSRGLTYAEWQQQTGLDEHSKFTKGNPSQLRITVRPNAYERGRANIAIVNPESLPSVEVDLSKALQPGQVFRIVLAQDFFGPSIVTGKYDGKPVSIPMQARDVPRPVGMSDFKLRETLPKFGAFVVLPRQ